MSTTGRAEVRPHRRLAGLALLIALIGAQTGPARADENWEAAKTAFEACVAHFPDVKTIHAKFKADGWRYEGTEAGLRIFTRNGYRAVAATQGNSQIATRCAVSASKLKPEPAIAFAEGVARQLNGVKPLDLSDLGIDKAWEGELRGKSLRLGVVPLAEFGVMRGATVVLGEF